MEYQRVKEKYLEKTENLNDAEVVCYYYCKGKSSCVLYRTEKDDGLLKRIYEFQGC